MKIKRLLILSFCAFFLMETYGQTYQPPVRGKKTLVTKGTATQPKGEADKASPKKKPVKKEKSLSAGRYLAVKTNLAYQAIAIQNLAADIQLTENLSLEVPLIWSFWDMEREHAIRTFTFQPELRWWFNGPGQQHFLGVHAHIGCFNVKWNDDRYQSSRRPLLGAGVSYGYFLPLDSNWGAEFTLGAGYANMRYNTYYNIDNGAKIDTRTLRYWGITRVGISLVYRF